MIRFRLKNGTEWQLGADFFGVLCLSWELGGAGERAVWQTAAAAGIVAAAMVLADLLRVDYGGSGPLLAALFYCYSRRRKPNLTVSFLLFCLSMGPITALVEVFGIVAVPLIARYNGMRRRKGRGRLFYLFYPAHLLILYLIAAS